MKKITMTLVILLGLTLGAFAQEGGLFGKGPSRGTENGYFRPTDSSDPLLNLPSKHGENTDEPAPLGSGVLVLAGLGAAYMVAKKNKKK